jgi:hypothetical protein
MAVNDQPAGRIVMGLFGEAVPKVPTLKSQICSAVIAFAAFRCHARVRISEAAVP